MHPINELAGRKIVKKKHGVTPFVAILLRALFKYKVDLLLFELFVLLMYSIRNAQAIYVQCSASSPISRWLLPRYFFIIGIFVHGAFLVGAHVPTCCHCFPSILRQLARHACGTSCGTRC